jgi:Protein involved in initiation of plasmid replication
LFCFELLKSYAFQKKPSYTFELDELKKQIGATKYNNFKDFRINVLELATREINQFTTINIQWEPIKKGRKVVQIVFYIRLKNEKDLFTAQESENQLEGQKNIYDYMDSDRNIIIT